jgi:5-methylthioadenosine/S-adenosylhomocysteine deaminase
MIPAVDPHLAAIVALSRTALGGVGAVQMHLTKPQGLTALPAEAATIARAAKDIGIRVGFAISMRDRNPFVYGPSEPVLESLPPEARAVFEAMALRLPPKPREFISICD